jgi:hypothetical protein
MAQSIYNFKSEFYGGTRKNRFLVEGSFPNGQWNKFQVLGASLPQVTLLTNEFNHRGRKLKLPGDRIYGKQGESSWVVNVLDDNNQNNSLLWSKLHDWSNSINNHETNTGSQDNPISYKRDAWTIKQLDLNCSTNPLKTVILYGCWPFSVGEIDLDMTANDEYVTFNVTFVFDYIDVIT